MGIIVANLFITLDGVYQGPGGREEDTEGGFAFGGWQAPVSDNEAEAAIEAEISNIDALLLGRKTYDIFAGYWLHQSDYPVTLGQGKRLFDAGTIPATFRLTEPARTFPKRAVSLVYERAGDVETQKMAAT